MFVVHGPEAASLLVVLAPGDASEVSDPVPTFIGEVFARAGVRVIRFGFPPCDTRDGAVRDALLADCIREAVAKEPGRRLVLGGLSRGARVAVSLVEELGAVGLVGFAYPFHHRQDPDPRGRDRQLASIAVPAWICQGTRDSRGNQQQVRGYRLPSHVQLHWLQDGNHALQPRPSSGVDGEVALTEAVEAAVAFMAAL